MAYVCAFLAGGILPFAFAPHDLWPLAFASLLILLWLWQEARTAPKRAFYIGLTYGLGMFGVGISWVIVSIHRYGNTALPIAILITSALVIVLSLFIAVQGYCLKHFFKNNKVSFWLLGFPSTWVLFEWLRSWLFTGFPWLYLGYTELHTSLSGYAPIASVYAVSWMVAITTGAIFTIIKGPRNFKILACILIASIWIGGQLLRQQSFTVLDPTSHSVSLIQGNIEPLDKFSQIDPILASELSYGRLTKKHWHSKLILWPESAIALPLPYSQPYIDKLQNIAKSHHATLITGVQIINEKGEYFNSLIALGNGHGIYHKHHLVPFGDFLPFEQWLRGLIHFFDLPMSSFISGPKEQSLIMANDLKLSPLICYEIAFPELVRDSLQNADAIITLSEDGWFGGSWGPHQHLQIAQMRALETGRYVLRATPTGITAIINPKGIQISTLPQFKAAVLEGTFYRMVGETPWVRMGLWPLLTLLALSFLLPIRFNRSSHKK